MTHRRKIDVREYPEFAGGTIEGAEWVPLQKLNEVCLDWDTTRPLMMVCRSGGRAEQGRALLESRGFVDVTVLPGGVEGWVANGGSIVKTQGSPWSLERQVRVGAGSLVVISLLLARLVSPLFLLATGFVGAGLIFAGVTDICMMARLLSLLPWNRPMRSRGPV